MSAELEKPVLKLNKRKSASFDPDALAAASDLTAGAGQFDVPAIIPASSQQSNHAPSRANKLSVTQRTERLTFYVTPHLMRAFRIRLIEEGTNMTTVLNAAIEDYLKRSKK